MLQYGQIILTKHYLEKREENYKKKSSNAAGLKPTETDDQVRFPKRAYVRSGYIILEKKFSKTKILDKISAKLVVKRAKQSK